MKKAMGIGMCHDDSPLLVRAPRFGQPSLRDFVETRAIEPSTKVLGYYRMSLRDKYDRDIRSQQIRIRLLQIGQLTTDN